MLFFSTSTSLIKEEYKPKQYYKIIFHLSDRQKFKSFIAQSIGEPVREKALIYTKWECKQRQFCNIYQNCKYTFFVPPLLGNFPIAKLALIQNNVLMKLLKAVLCI